MIIALSIYYVLCSLIVHNTFYYKSMDDPNEWKIRIYDVHLN